MNSSGQDTKDSVRQKPKLGIIGGSGMCSFPELKVIEEVWLTTKYGNPSDVISICEFEDMLIAFLPRHGRKHSIAPHKIPYKANLTALQQLGVETVIGTCIVGSLNKQIFPGSIVIPDQFVNLTWGRDDSSKEDEGAFLHLPMAEPYCNQLRKSIVNIAHKTTLPVVNGATVVVIQGPRFSTKAESQWFSRNGWDIVNMTQYPECYFARELGLCYASISAVTDYDVGLQEDLTMDPKHMPEVLEIFKANIQRTKNLLLAWMQNSYPDFACSCSLLQLKTYYEDSL